MTNDCCFQMISHLLNACSLHSSLPHSPPLLTSQVWGTKTPLKETRRKFEDVKTMKSSSFSSSVLTGGSQTNFKAAYCLLLCWSQLLLCIIISNFIISRYYNVNVPWIIYCFNIYRASLLYPNVSYPAHFIATCQSAIKHFTLVI